MDTVWKTLYYLTNLEWREKKQLHCIFCDRDRLQSVVYQDDTVIAVDNLRNAGRMHWLIIPKVGPTTRHIRDIEALTLNDTPLLKKLDEVKELLLKRHCPAVPRSSIHCGYHRGRRQLIGSIILPDIVSVHHLHLHVIVEPRTILRIFKYPTWLRFMWKSDEKVMAETVKREKPRMMLKGRMD